MQVEYWGSSMPEGQERQATIALLEEGDQGGTCLPSAESFNKYNVPPQLNPLCNAFWHSVVQDQTHFETCLGPGLSYPLSQKSASISREPSRRQSSTGRSPR